MIESFNECSFPIASHDLNGFFNYLNKAALSLFKVTLDQVIGQPTTMTAPESEQKERNELLNQVNSHGFIDNYKGMQGHEKRNYDEYSNEHPIVRTHPETGKKILYVNWTYTKQIVGFDKLESDKLLKKIFEHQARLDLTCRFQWTENAVAIWDNRSVLHYAIADFFPGKGLGYERVMDRIAIEGDRPH